MSMSTCRFPCAARISWTPRSVLHFAASLLCRFASPFGADFITGIFHWQPPARRLFQQLAAVDDPTTSFLDLLLVNTSLLQTLIAKGVTEFNFEDQSELTEERSVGL